MQFTAGHDTAAQAALGPASHPDSLRAIIHSCQTGDSASEHLSAKAHATAHAIYPGQHLPTAQPASAPSNAKVTRHKLVAPALHMDLSKVQRSNARSAADTAGTKQLWLLQPPNLAQDADPGPTRERERGDADLEPVLARGVDGMEDMHQPACSSPGQLSQSSRANLPRSVRLWMERRANSSGSVPSQGSSHHALPSLAHEWNQSAQGVNLASQATAMGGKLEHVPDERQTTRLINGSNRLRPLESKHRQHEVVQSVQSSASSHTHLACSTDWALDGIPGRGLIAGEQHVASDSGSDSRRSVSPATTSAWEIDSRTGSLCPASETAAVPDQQRTVHARSLTAIKASCNAGSQAGLHNRPARDAKGNVKARQNVRQRRTTNAQVEKQAFR